MAMENTMASKAAPPAPEASAVHAQAMPLSLMQADETAHVQRIRGKDNTQRFLRNLGFVEGAEVTVISALNGSVIVNVKGTRVAISKAMANRVLTN